MKDRPADHQAIVIVVATVATCTAATIATIAALALLNRPIPEVLDRIATALALGLLGLIAKTSSGPQEVTNPPGEQLEVDPNPPKRGRQ